MKAFNQRKRKKKKRLFNVCETQRRHSDNKMHTTGTSGEEKKSKLIGESV